MHTFIRRTKLNASRSDVFAWHMRPDAFEFLKPPWVNMQILEHGGVKDDSKVRLAIRFGPFGFNWTLRHCDVIPGEQFVDVQIAGPFRSWHHTHRFIDDGAGCVIEDTIKYALPIELPGLSAFIERDLDRLFAYRSEVLSRELNGR